MTTNEYGNELAAEPTYFEQIPHWVMSHPDITGNAIRLYLQLRKYSNKDFTAYPSRRRLADDLGISIPTVDSAKEVLISIGAITMEHRGSPTNNSQTSNLYTVMWQEPVNNLARGGKETYTGVVKKPAQGWEKNPHTNLYPINSNPTNPNIVTADPFDEFWLAYPRKAGKAAARKSFTVALKTTNAQTLIAAATNYRCDPNREDQYTKHPATWLNQGCWDDDPLPLKQGPMSNLDRKRQQQAEMIAYFGQEQTGQIEA